MKRYLVCLTAWTVLACVCSSPPRGSIAGRWRTSIGGRTMFIELANSAEHDYGLRCGDIEKRIPDKRIREM